MTLACSMLGLHIPHPFIAGASPLGGDLDTIRRLEDGGAAAIVLPSLFEEQVTLATEGRIRHMDAYDPHWSACLQYFPTPLDYAFSPDQYADHIARVRKADGIPVIGSLNGTTGEAWLKFSRLIQQAGASALELNMYEVVTDPRIDGTTIERQIVHVVSELKRYVRIPIAVKLSPYFASFGNLAQRLDQAGADGLVLFNRFYQPDIDTATMGQVPEARLSTNTDLLLRLRWLAILYGRLRPSLIATGGIATPEDGIKAILAGATAAQVVSAIFRHGPAYFKTLRAGLEHWMQEHQISSVDDMRGRAGLKNVDDPAAHERAHYIKTLQSVKAASAPI
jgi:dihydroorotate dehydrogenase (fumarate)